MTNNAHLHDELAASPRIRVQTRYGPVTGARAGNGAAAFLEVPYALPPARFTDPVKLPSDFRYDEKEYIAEATYAVQPSNDGQQGDTRFEDKVGFGQPSENPLFVNIVVPPSFPESKGFPVKIYIHGGFLQFGSPHGLSSQAQYIAAERSEVWVNIGYRLSAFGFLACDAPSLGGNYGFKDQWLAIEWVKSNIEAFGGNPEDIEISGLSAGAHSLHQLLHHASHLPHGEVAPFHSAVLQSNAIVYDPKTPKELRSQFQALCRALNLDPDDPEVLSTLRDPEKIPASLICHVIETNALGVEFGAFRACLDNDWLPVGEMDYQRNGTLAKNLLSKGIRRITIGDLTEEWYLYSIADPIASPDDIRINLERYYPASLVKNMLGLYPALPPDANPEVLQPRYGEILCDWQVHLPVRILARDLLNARFPVLRYEIRWTPEQNRTAGYVTHGTDRSLWAFRLPILNPDQVSVARSWLDTVDEEKAKLGERWSPTDVLVLDEDRSIHWTEDTKWEAKLKLGEILVESPL